MIFETLSVKHLAMLCQFEMENRAWFESIISPREDYFYTPSGVKMHIFDSILNMKIGSHYSGVLIINDRIVARGNLKDICTESNTASIGYRVAADSTGKGYATYCLTKLISIAANTYSTHELEALVLDNNPASKAVLQKLGFTIKSHEDDYIELCGVKLGCTTYSNASLTKLIQTDD